MTVETDAGGVRGVKSAARTVDLLEMLASRQNRPAKLREISDALNAPRSSVYALLRTLSERGWVRSDDGGSSYGIGIRALLAGTTYLDTDPYLRIVQPLITELSDRLGETVHFGRVDRTDIVYLATAESREYHRSFSRVGRRLPAFSTSMGKAILAERIEVLEDHLPRVLRPLTPKTIVDEAELRADLEAIRERGYSIDDEENYPGIVCFGLPLRYARPAHDAISCSVPMDRLRDPARREEIVAEMQRIRLAIERLAPVVDLTPDPETWA